MPDCLYVNLCKVTIWVAFSFDHGSLFGVSNEINDVQQDHIRLLSYIVTRVN